MAEDLHVKGKDLKDLKVIELKKELHDRGLTTSGNKSDLIARLQEYLNFENSEIYQNSSVDANEDLANLNLEIEILKSRVGSMQSLMNSQGNATTPSTRELHSEIVLLKIDLEEEKLRNTCLEREVRRLQQEIEIINSYRNGPVSTNDNTELINMPPTHYQGSQLSSQVLVTNNQINIQQYNNEDIVVAEDDHHLSSNVLNTNDQMSVQLSNNKDIVVVEGVRQSSSEALNTNEKPSFDEQIYEYIQKHKRSSHNQRKEKSCKQRMYHPRWRGRENKKQKRFCNNENAMNSTVCFDIFSERRENFHITNPKRRPPSKPPSYRTSHRHHSLEWLKHLDYVHRKTTQ